jgi:hypothetical protein
LSDELQHQQCGLLVNGKKMFEKTTEVYKKDLQLRLLVGQKQLIVKKEGCGCHGPLSRNLWIV